MTRKYLQTLFGFVLDDDSKGLGVWLKKYPDQIDWKDESGWGLLHLAASRGLGDCVKVLMEQGANKELLDPDGWTPLHHLAEFSQNLEVLNFMIDQGIVLDAVSYHGDTALHFAARQNEGNGPYVGRGWSCR